MSNPPLRLDKCIADKREPGLTLFNVRPGGKTDRMMPGGWLLGIDRAGEINFCRHYDPPPQDTKTLPDGNILSASTSGDAITEMTLDGEIVRQWYSAGKYAEDPPPIGAIRVDAPLFHHRINTLANGNMLLLSVEFRDFDKWPSSDTDPNAPLERASLAADVVMEVSPDGEIVSQWHLFDLLDPYRLCYGSRNDYWVRRGFLETQDWCHANSVSHDPVDDSILVSLRTQDCIIKFSRSSGKLIWILGDHGNWRKPWAEKLLSPVGELAWQYHQHDCTVTPQGTFLCFDNGNYRALPFEPKLPPEKNRSRMVEFEVDETDMTVRQVRAWDGGDEHGLYACYQGGAYRLPKTGNTLITYGGIVTKDELPEDVAEAGFCRSRIVEVTPEDEIVFDLWIDGGEEDVSLSSFRAEHYPYT